MDSKLGPKPYWTNNWSTGRDRRGIYHRMTIAPSRAERRKKGADIIIYQEELVNLKPEERHRLYLSRLKAAIVQVGLAPELIGAFARARLQGWEGIAKPTPQLVEATH